MLRKIIAFLVGFLIADTLPFVFYLIPYIKTEYPIIWLFLWPLTSLFIAGFVTGYIARNMGWLLGFTIGIVIVIYVIVSPNLAGAGFGIVDVFYVLTLLMTTAGGHLGERLAQKRHKRVEEKPDASQSESS